MTQELADARATGAVVICAPVYVELAAHPRVSRIWIDEFLSATGITVEFVLDKPVWQMASVSFAAYSDRRRKSGGGTAKRVPVDFLIASHAMLHADRLMTLDAKRYQRDFPRLHLV